MFNIEYRRISHLAIFLLAIFGSIPSMARASSQVHIVTSLPVDDDLTVHLLKGIGQQEQDTFTADSPDAPQPQAEDTITGGPFYKWTLTVQDSIAQISPTDQSSTVFTATSSTAFRTTYTLSVECWWTESGPNAPDGGKTGDSTDNVFINMSFVKPGLQINAAGNWQSLDNGQHLYVVSGTKYTFKYDNGVTPPPDPSAFSWSGASSNGDGTATATFETDGDYSVSISVSGEATTVTVTAFTPEVTKMYFQDGAGGPLFPLYDPSRNADYPFAGSVSTDDPQTPTATSYPACFQQGKGTGVKIEFYYKGYNLSFKTKVNAIGTGNATYIGGPYGANVTLNTGDRSGWSNLTSAGSLAPTLASGSVAVAWEYAVPTPAGTGTFHGAGGTSSVNVCVIYAHPCDGGSFRGGEGWVVHSDITYAHVSSAIGLWAAGPSPVTPANIAHQMHYNRGSAGVSTQIDVSNVDLVWNDYLKQVSIGCYLQAHGLAYGLRFIGVPGNIAYVNLAPAVKNSPDSPGAKGSVDKKYYYYDCQGPGGWSEFEGCVYLDAYGATTWCLEGNCPTENFYWAIGNDERANLFPPPAGRAGTAFEYYWYPTDSSSARCSIDPHSASSWDDSAGGPLFVPTSPNYVGN